MHDITIKLDRDVNLTALDRVLRQRFGDRIAGASRHGNEFIIHFLDAPDDRDGQAAAEIIEQHDPNELTPEQAQDRDDLSIGRELLGMLDNRIAWHEQNKPTDVTSALETVRRMQTEWLYLLRLIRAGAIRVHRD